MWWACSRPASRWRLSHPSISCLLALLWLCIGQLAKPSPTWDGRLRCGAAARFHGVGRPLS